MISRAFMRALTWIGLFDLDWLDEMREIADDLKRQER